MLHFTENAGNLEDMRRIENLECEECGNRNNQANQDFQVWRKEDTEMKLTTPDVSQTAAWWKRNSICSLRCQAARVGVLDRKHTEADLCSL